MHTISIGRRGYHSYPDPNDKGVETRSLAKDSDVKAQILDKSGPTYALDDSYEIENVFPGVPSGSRVEAGAAPATQHTVLPSGLTVASHEMPGLMTSFAFMVGTGSSYEDQQNGGNTGVTQMLELTAFKSTRSGRDISTEIESLGGLVQCISTRENVLYCVDVLRENLEPALDILADAVLCPSFPADEIADAKEVAALMVDEMPSDMLSRDAAQMAAYPGSPMGQHHYCPMEKIEAITPEMVSDFHRKNFVGSNCYVVAAGVDHSYFLSLVKERFGDIAVTHHTREELQNQRRPSIYKGGMVKSERGLKEPYVKVAVAFEAGGWDDPDVIPKCVLNQLLGGGSSFSAGGPGKGMYTRLYTQVLNQYSFTESMEAFIGLNEKDGLMGIDASCAPEFVPHIIRIIMDQLVKLAVEPVSHEELDRARNMCKSMLLMQLESRVVLCEDMARQFVTYGKRFSPADTCALIEKVTAEDLMRVADDMLNNPPAIGCVGHDLSKVPEYKDIKDFTQMYVNEGRAIRNGKGRNT
eukprot:GSChrysophyteH1.ASY1.ANO1.2596.1 assembled CDS